MYNNNRGRGGGQTGGVNKAKPLGKPDHIHVFICIIMIIRIILIMLTKHYYI